MISIDDKEVYKRMCEASEHLATFDFHTHVVSQGAIPHRASARQIEITSALEVMLGTYQAVANYVEITLETNTYAPDSDEYRKRRVFGNRLATYIACEAGLKTLHSDEPATTAKFDPLFELPLIQPTAEYTAELTKRVAEFTQKADISTDAEFSRITDHLLQQYKGTAVRGSEPYAYLFDAYPDLGHASLIGMDFTRFSRDQLKKKEGGLTWDDYIGQEEIVAELKAVAEYVRDPSSFLDWGGQLPRGIALAAKPGLGKTFIAQVFSDECGLPFHEIKISDVFSKYVGDGAKNINRLLTQPGIVFLDEFDSLSKKVDGDDSHESTEQIVNTMKQVMDGIDSKNWKPGDPVTFYIAATNHPQQIEPALLRPGRLMLMHMQDYGAAALGEIGALQMKRIRKRASGRVKIFDSDIDSGVLGNKFAEKKMTPADIESIYQKLATQKGREQNKRGKDAQIAPISHADLEYAIENFVPADDVIARMKAQQMLSEGEQLRDVANALEEELAKTEKKE